MGTALREKEQTWPTPRARGDLRRDRNGKGGPSLGVALRAEAPQQFPTPTVNRNYNKLGGGHGNSGDGLITALQRRRDPTPLARDCKGRTHRKGSLPNLVPDGVWINPQWGEWPMGCPLGWTDLEPIDPVQVAWWEAFTSMKKWWDHEPVARFIGHRSVSRYGARWRALGNGQVPAQAVAAFSVLGDV